MAKIQLEGRSRTRTVNVPVRVQLTRVGKRQLYGSKSNRFLAPRGRVDFYACVVFETPSRQKRKGTNPFKSVSCATSSNPRAAIAGAMSKAAKQLRSRPGAFKGVK